MSDGVKTKNDIAWEQIFIKHDILNRIDVDERFEISAAQIKEFREPRLMAKLDHTDNLPDIFKKNRLATLPITRGNYVIAHFDAYHKLENVSPNIIKVPLPAYIQSLDSNNISSEAIALNCAAAAGIISDFLNDEALLPTVSGRMGSGVFSFSINDMAGTTHYGIKVSNSQIEIDNAYEGVGSLALFEAKRSLPDDFLIRQLYYPFRLWQNRVTKPVRTLFLVYSNGIYRLYEYRFEDIDNYNSLVLMRQKNYSVEDTRLDVSDIQDILQNVRPVAEPEIPFPQANSFERVINICELLSEKELNRDDITEQYAFDARQTGYYTDAARYLGLLEKRTEKRVPVYHLSKLAKRILGMNYKQRQLSYCRLILAHKVFGETLKIYFDRGVIPETNEIIRIMKESSLYRVEADNTIKRRSSTVRGWIQWIIGIINE